MHFQYEITVDDYIASQLLYWQLTSGGKRFQNAALWILIGSFIIVVARSEKLSNWGTLLLVIVGAILIVAGFQNLFPSRYIRRAYKKLDLAGRIFNAQVDEEGFEVTEDLRLWRVKWQGASPKGESDKVFIYHSAGTIFIFGKKYLTPAQQDELRKLSGLA